MCRVGMLVLLPVGRVPVYCRVGQRSAVLWRQIAVGCWSTDHSDPKQFCGVLQGDKHRFILSQQAKLGRLRFSVAPPGMSQYEWSLIVPFTPWAVFHFSFLGELVVSPLLTCPPQVNNTLLGPGVRKSKKDKYLQIFWRVRWKRYCCAR